MIAGWILSLGLPFARTGCAFAVVGFSIALLSYHQDVFDHLRFSDQLSLCLRFLAVPLSILLAGWILDAFLEVRSSILGICSASLAFYLWLSSDGVYLLFQNPTDYHRVGIEVIALGARVIGTASTAALAVIIPVVCAELVGRGTSDEYTYKLGVIYRGVRPLVVTVVLSVTSVVLIEFCMSRFH